MKKAFLVILITFPLLVAAQTWKSRPFSVQVFNNATLLPPKSVIAVFNNIRNYFSKELSDRGFQVNIEQPDLLLELDVANVPHTVRHVYRDDYYYNRYYFRSQYYSPYERRYYYRYYPSYSYSNPYRRVIIDSHINNSVTLNIVDAKERKLLWTGTVEADIYDPKVIQEDIHPAVIKLMKRFPVQPIQSVDKQGVVLN